MEAKLQKAFFALKDHNFAFSAQTSRDALRPVVQPWQAGAGNHCGDAHPTGMYSISGEGEREFWQGICTAPDPEGYCSDSFTLYRDIISEMLGAVSDSPKPHHESIGVRECPG